MSTWFGIWIRQELNNFISCRGKIHEKIGHLAREDP